MRLRAWLLLLAAATGLAASARASPGCPAIAAKAEQVVLVLAPTMTASQARVRYLERALDGRWRIAGPAKSAAIGRGGLGWSWAFKDFADGQEPVKTEGDKRTPAGFFAVGRAFGSASGRDGGYVRLRRAEHFCVDDPASADYNKVVPKAKAGEGVSGEDMAAEPLYREGVFLDYPTSRQARGGSCIFVHVWKGASRGTVGCVALAEGDVVEMQRRTAGKRTIMAILPEKAWERLRGCFPGL